MVSNQNLDLISAIAPDNLHVDVLIRVGVDVAQDLDGARVDGDVGSAKILL